jgi:hypothetical protein
LSVVSFGIMAFGVDLGKSQAEQEKFLQDKKRRLDDSESSSTV